MPDGQMLEFSGVTKRFGAVTAVDGLNARVEPGLVTGFLGPNGAGKTTSLRILLGLVRASDGTATIGGKRYAELAHPLQTVGAVLEASSFHPGRTAAAHLTIYANAAGVPKARVDEVLGLVGLTDAAGRKVGGFSLGMRQRLGLAYALLGDPGVLVLDEPANGLDPEGIRWMRGFLRQLAAEGRTVLVSSHLLAEVQQTVDALLIISRGRLVFQGSLDELADPSEHATIVDAPDRSALGAALQSSGVPFEVLRSGLTVRGVDPTAVGAVAAGAGVALSSLHRRGPALEEVFLDLVNGTRVHASAGGEVAAGAGAAGAGVGGAAVAGAVVAGAAGAGVEAAEVVAADARVDGADEPVADEAASASAIEPEEDAGGPVQPDIPERVDSPPVTSIFREQASSPEPEAPAEPQAPAEAEPESGEESEAQVAFAPEPEPASEFAPEAAAEPEPEHHAEPEHHVEPEPEAEAAPEPEPEPEMAFAPEPESHDEPEGEASVDAAGESSGAFAVASTGVIEAVPGAAADPWAPQDADTDVEEIADVDEELSEPVDDEDDRPWERAVRTDADAQADAFFAAFDTGPVPEPDSQPESPDPEASDPEPAPEPEPEHDEHQHSDHEGGDR